jgi:sensor histidine kinase regulating citrate/malate metabolism
VRRPGFVLACRTLQNAIFKSANFSSIATDEKGVIQIFNAGAERMLRYAAADVVNKITPADISDPLEVIARTAALNSPRKQVEAEQMKLDQRLRDQLFYTRSLIESNH